MKQVKLEIIVTTSIDDTDQVNKEGRPIRFYRINKFTVSSLKNDISGLDLRNVVFTLSHLIGKGIEETGDYDIVSMETDKINDILLDLGIPNKLDNSDNLDSEYNLDLNIE